MNGFYRESRTIWWHFRRNPSSVHPLFRESISLLFQLLWASVINTVTSWPWLILSSCGFEAHTGYFELYQISCRDATPIPPGLFPTALVWDLTSLEISCVCPLLPATQGNFFFQNWWDWVNMCRFMYGNTLV